MASTEIIVQRRLPTYDVLVTVAMEPSTAGALLESFFGREPGFDLTGVSQRSHLADGRRRVEIRPSRFWSLYPIVSARVVPSVAGSNVYVRMRIQAFWWALIFVLATLFLLTSSHTLHEILPGSLLVLVIVALAAVAYGVLRAVRIAVSALSEEAARTSAGRDSVSIVQTRIMAAAVVAILIISGVVARRGYVRYRDGLLVHADFPVGASRQAVIARLGEPDLELVGGELQIGATGSDRECVNRATKELDYFGSRSSGVYCSVYLDREDLVICVEHGVPRNS